MTDSIAWNWLDTGIERHGFVVGLGMNGRGAVEIVIASMGLSAGIMEIQ